MAQAHRLRTVSTVNRAYSTDPHESIDAIGNFKLSKEDEEKVSWEKIDGKWEQVIVEEEEEVACDEMEKASPLAAAAAAAGPAASGERGDGGAPPTPPPLAPLAAAAVGVLEIEIVVGKTGCLVVAADL